MWANYVGKLLSNFKGFYNEINSATLTGAIDVVVVKQEDGSYVSSPFHVRFGKMGVLRAREKIVDIEINGEPVDLQMKLGEAGEAFFVEETEESEFPEYLATSPIPDYAEMMEQGLESNRHRHTSSSSAAEELHRVSFSSATLSEISRALEHNPLTRTQSEVVLPKMLEAAEAAEKESETVLSSSLDDKKSDTGVIEMQVPSIQLPPQSPSIATQTVITGSEVEERVSRTPPREADPNASSRPLVERMPSVLTGEASTSPPSRSYPPHVVRLEPILSAETETAGSTDEAPRQKRRFRRKKYGSSPGRGSPARSPVRFYTDSSPRGLVKPKALKAGDDEPKSPGEKTENMFTLDMSDEEGETQTPVGSLENGMMAMTSMGRTISMPVIQDASAMTEEWRNSHTASAFHPFSDTDITPIMSPIGSRPPSPKSDTEYETQKYDVMSQTLVTSDDFSKDDVKWRWGELPEKTPDVTSQAKDKDKNVKFAVGKDSDDKPKQAGLFQFMRKTKKIRHQPEQGGIYLDDLNMDEMDPEIAQLYLYQTKPGQHRVFKDEDNESGRGASLPQSPVSIDSDHGHQRDYLKTYHKHDQGQPDISMSLCGGLKESEDIPTDRFLQDMVTYDEFCENPNIMQDPNLVIKIDDKFYNWQIAGPIVMSAVVFQRPIPEDQETTSGSQPSSEPSSPPNSPEKHAERDHKKPTDDGSTDEDLNASSDATATQRSSSRRSSFRRHEKYKKTLKLTSEQIVALGLKEGESNEVTFSVTTAYQGTARCVAYIYVWKWDDRIIVSDIDGTVTRSDVLGHVLPMIGKDWSQAGIAKLYNMIANNGYKFLYLSARAIGQSRVTRDYLRGVRQGDLALPDGPLLLSPSSLISAFHKEVIERKPEEFKIGCLRDISALFPLTKNPFFAGYGNKVNDVWAYRAVGIPISRIFTVNHKGELRMEQLKTTFQSSYTSLTDITDHFFPPLLDKQKVGKTASGNFHAADAYSSFTYWREPLPDVEIDIDALSSASSPAPTASNNQPEAGKS